jgi:DNA-binding CsgD family transcriptional regulator
VLQVDSRGRVAYATEAAGELLGTYCGVTSGGPHRLPARVQRWLAEAQESRNGRAHPLVIDGTRGRLRVRELLDGPDHQLRALIVEEQRAEPPSIQTLRRLGLTERQAQVLRLLATGRANQQIAQQLQIAPATVEKHLEQIYQRLGVASRTQALARVYG